MGPVELGLRASAPVVESLVRVHNFDGRSLRLLGVDPFAEAPFRDYLTSAVAADGGGQLEALYAFVTHPNTVLISDDMARRYGVQAGDTLTVQTRKLAEVQLTVVGTLAPGDDLSRQALENLVLVDISTAQEIVGEPGQLTRIDLILPQDFDLDTVRSLLPSGTALITPSQSADALSQMTAAFELNLQALSLLALLVGMFLIYNTVSFSVVQRRPVLGILRSLGTTRRQIFELILFEALILGSVGTALGLALGVVMGQGAVRLVAQTVNDLYFRVTVEEVTLDRMTLVRGALIGVLASLIAAGFPALEATSTPPSSVLQRSNLEQQARRRLPLWTAAALALVAGGFLLLRLPSESIVVAFAALFAVLLGGALITPLALVGLSRAVVPLSERAFGVLGRMAPRSLARSLSRTGIAVAALTLTVSVIVGVSAMISSFRTTLIEWLDMTLGADIFISPYAQETESLAADLDPTLAAALSQMDGVRRVTTLRTAKAIAPAYPELPPVNVVAPSVEITSQPRRFAWSTIPQGDYWTALEDGAAIVSEAFAFKRAITAERNRISLLTKWGEETFTVVGAYYDYTTDQGTLMLHQDVYRAFFDDPYLSAVALELEPGVSDEEFVDVLRAGPLAGTGLDAQSNRSLRANVLAIFERTFAITVALRLLAIVVAFIGILSALMALQLENTRVYAIMRANGMTPRQMSALTLLETGLMGIAAGVLALPIGVVLALILVYEINVRSFGWTLEFAPEPAGFLQAIGVALAAALAAGVYPAWRLGRLAAAEALRSE